MCVNGFKRSFQVDATLQMLISEGDLRPARLASSAYISLSCFCGECSPVTLRFGQSEGSHSRMKQRFLTVDALAWERGLAPDFRC